MSGREWTPGDVAMAHWDAKEVRGFIDADGRFYTTDQRAKGIAANHPAFQPENLRPMVVIDPEDREQIKAIYRALRALDSSYDAATQNDLQTVFRSLVTPPKPDEPMGLGAVVEDDEGVFWTHVEVGQPETLSWLRSAGGIYRRWGNIAAATIHGQGVTP